MLPATHDRRLTEYTQNVCTNQVKKEKAPFLAKFEQFTQNLLIMIKPYHTINRQSRSFLRHTGADLHRDRFRGEALRRRFRIERSAKQRGCAFSHSPNQSLRCFLCDIGLHDQLAARKTPVIQHRKIDIRRIVCQVLCQNSAGDRAKHEVADRKSVCRERV